MSSPLNPTKNALFKSSIQADSVHIGDNVTNSQITLGKPVFTNINLDLFDESNGFVSPRFTGKMVSSIMSSKNGLMAAITGFYGFDKASFTKHLALKITEEWERKGRTITTKECLFTSDYFGIAAYIREYEEDCIFILNNIKPKDVNHNLSELRDVSNGHACDVIILVSTDLPKKSWKNPGEDYWFTIKIDGLYHQGTLLTSEVYSKNDLLRFMLRNSSRLGLGDYKESLKKELGKLIPSELDTPEQISLFLDLFEKKPTDDAKKIKDLVVKTRKKDTLISQWFYSLDDTKRLIALGLTLFEGVYDDQFFAIMNSIGKEAWENYKECPSALDYEDLNPLLHFFSFTSGESPILEAKFPNQRYQTLMAVWENYRRRIIATLPMLVKLAIQSVEASASSWELFGDKKKRNRLRASIASIFSDIGRFSPSVVEPWLLQLAVHGNVGVQLVAAKAMAAWREAYDDPNEKGAVNKEKELFVLLKNWYNESRKSRSRISQARSLYYKSDASKNSPSSYVRATILLTLGFASVYDESNVLHPEIFDLVKKFAKDRSKLVISRLQDTLRLLLRNHPRQIGDKLFDFDEKGDCIFNLFLPLENYAHSIASGLADAHVDYPSDVEDLLDGWLSYCRVNRPKQPDLEKLSFREKVLCTVALTYRQLKFDKTVILSLDKAANNLDEFRKGEHNPVVRTILLDVILSLYEKYYSDMESRHIKTIPNMDVTERKFASWVLLNKYLYERNKLAGGDYELKLEDYAIDDTSDLKVVGYSMESWRNPEDRPLAEIEEVLSKWLKSKNETILNIALQAFIEFSKIEAWETEEIKQYLEDEDNNNNKDKFKLPEYDDKVRKGLWTNLRSFFGVGNRVRDNLMALVKEDNNMGKEQIEILKEKLSRLGHSI